MATQVTDTLSQPLLRMSELWKLSLEASISLPENWHSKL